MDVATKKHRYGKERTQTFSLSGMNYRVSEKGQKEMSEKTPIMVALIREPNNQHDENAISVHLETYRRGMHIGYVPRGVASVLAPLMDSGDLLVSSAWLTKVNPKAHEGELLVTLRKKLHPNS
jgi:HIRAN domain